MKIITKINFVLILVSLLIINCKQAKLPEMNSEVQNIVKTYNCYFCHGTDFQGQNDLPPLTKISSKYSKDELTNYLINPTVKPNTNYSTRMISLKHLDKQQLALLVDYLMKIE